MRRKLVLAGTAVAAFCVSSLPAYAAGTTHSGGGSCIGVASACSVSGSHYARSFTNWCTVANGIYTSCQFEHGCSATARGTLATGSLTCTFGTPSTCSASTAGSCSMNSFGTTTVAFNACATFAIDAKATSPVGGTAQWTDNITMCVNPNTGPYVL
ncbi:MAG TPA: hypothetical protein VF519_05025 [Mycobacteriales bacterium]|jgi:hypothetical protein